MLGKSVLIYCDDYHMGKQGFFDVVLGNVPSLKLINCSALFFQYKTLVRYDLNESGLAYSV